MKKRHEPDRKVGTHRNNVAAKRKIMQPVVRTVREGIFLAHCYLACGHMVTMHKEDLEESAAPSSIECWACEEETKKKG